jgi:hypothetical protein
METEVGYMGDPSFLVHDTNKQPQGVYVTGEEEELVQIQLQLNDFKQAHSVLLAQLSESFKFV